ncbi:hypothetical protein RN001_001870 [Aquatica leii]|uniref:Uncharacterized protein n=1 Tax=Aquatica leii TaxID=1421715 RepID=A0AAN7SLJ0_9COLE|nr:hypothetical protein RN001_001870 [Aquatica leii]
MCYSSLNIHTRYKKLIIMPRISLEQKSNIVSGVVRAPENWKPNIRKVKKEKEEVYVDRKGKQHPARQIKSECRGHCAFNCCVKFTDEEKALVFEQFWRLSDSKKSHFYSKFVKRNPVSLRKVEVKNDKKTRKMYSYNYFLEVYSDRRIVYKEFFLSTLNISSRRVYYFFKHIQNEVTNVPRSPLKGKKLFRYHINSFARLDSHYCRATLSKKYLDFSLNISRMYNLYLQQIPTDKTPVTKAMYSKIFNTEFNLSFAILKKDLCDKLDAVHSVIERYLRHKNIYSPVSLVRQLVYMPKKYKTKLKVLQMSIKDVLNFQFAAQQFVHSIIPYTKIKHIVYTSESLYTLSYKKLSEDNFEVTQIV